MTVKLLQCAITVACIQREWPVQMAATNLPSGFSRRALNRYVGDSCTSDYRQHPTIPNSTDALAELFHYLKSPADTRLRRAGAMDDPASASAQNLSRHRATTRADR